MNSFTINPAGTGGDSSIDLTITDFDEDGEVCVAIVDPEGVEVNAWLTRDKVEHLVYQLTLMLRGTPKAGTYYQ